MEQAADAKIWIPAVYARLSDEDKESKKNGADVSLSIENQIDILTGYVKDKGWQAPKVFYDDDRTGTNFDREGWQNLYAEAQAGNINVIVIKDTSRFGRNWVQSGDYFQKIEAMGIRFICIQEGLDTADPNCPALKMLPFYFIFNEWHSQTTSEKIRATFKKQAEQGKFRAHYAPYGYEKDPDDKHKLIVDPYASGIVKRIFAMRLEKQSFGAIARKLNDEGILSPSGYEAEKREVENKRSKFSKWSANIVMQTLSNPVYCGDVVHNKVGCVSYKNQKQVRKPVDEWVIVKDMHTAIVSREDFQKCVDMRENLGRVRSTQQRDISPFSGLIQCPDCGYKMRRTTSYYTVRATGEKKLIIGYNCGARASMGKMVCSSHYILERDLSELVIADVREKAQSVVQDEDAARERYYALKAQSNGTQLNADKNALSRISKRLADLDKLLQAAFEKSVLGGESAELFLNLELKYQAERRELTEQAGRVSASIDKHSQTASDVETFIGLMKKYSNITDLDRAAAVELIDHITVSASAVKPREIVIYYNLMGNV